MSINNPWQINMLKGVTPLSHDMYTLHMIALSVCIVIGLIVFGVMIYSLIHHRKAKGYPAASFHENTKLEIVWTIIPFVILIGLAVPATRILFRMYDTRDADLTIKVVGYQWKWEYQYLDQGIRFFSQLSTPLAQIENQQPKTQWYLREVDKPLILPIHKKIRFLVTSQDVIHSWWVPELGIKRDAIPGYMYESWAWIDRPGTYRGQCAELCGINHAYMPIVVHALREADFEQWVASQTPMADQYTHSSILPAVPILMTRTTFMKFGQAKYEQMCAMCHKVDGTGMPPVYPALKASSICIGHPIARHLAMILNGVPGSAMQAYRDQLSDAEIAAIATYERNAWGNQTRDRVSPEDVAKIRRHGEGVIAKIVHKSKRGSLT